MSTVGLVHGAWHGSWCWQRLEAELDRHGHRTVAVDLPAEDGEAGLERYAETVASAVGDADDVVLVGHSLGGATIPLVAARRPVRHLVFVCAVLPEDGRCLADRYGDSMFVPGFAGNTQTHEDGSSYWPDPDVAAALFYHDCAPADAAWAATLLRRQAARPARDPWPSDAIPDVERTSVVCRDERCVSPEWSRRMSRGQLGVEPVELEGGHSPFLSRPATLAGVIAGVCGS